ncbi:MAG: LppX_LprAFG lipoprotein [Terracoccus sp.]
MSHRITLRRAVATAVVVPAVLLASACGSSTPTAATPAAMPAATQPPSSGPAAGSGDPASNAAPSTTATSSSAAPVAKGDVATAQFIAALKAAGADTTTAHVSMSLSGAGQSMKMDGDTRLDASNPAMALKMSLSGMDLQVRVVDKKVYLKGLPNQAAGRWAVFDENSTIGKQMSQAAAQSDPNRMYVMFDRGLTKVKKVGTETVDGEQMAKYDLTLDTKALGGSTAAGAVSLPKTVSYTAWVDSKDHLRKVTFGLVGVTSTVTISKYGEPVDVTAPAAKDVVKGSGL